jgi:hypothetical protein
MPLPDYIAEIRATLAAGGNLTPEMIDRIETEHNTDTGALTHEISTRDAVIQQNAATLTGLNDTVTQLKVKNYDLTMMVPGVSTEKPAADAPKELTPDSLFGE